MGKEKSNNKQKKVKYRTAEQEEMIKFLGVILVVVVCVLLVYFLTRAFVTKDLFNKKDENQSEEVVQGSVNYSVASVGQILNRPYDEYYVFVYDSTSDYATDMVSLKSEYNSSEKKLHTYTVDLSNYLNKDYYKPKDVNTKATKVSEFKFGDITLIKVKNGEVSKYITDYTKMQSELKITKK